ncbi:MAG: inorganic phosphate transporter family protein [Bdellovibrionales bacterium]|nr:inorganic phosphate transporter family protein [Bdellovibrionales bacterium]
MNLSSLQTEFDLLYSGFALASGNGTLALLLLALLIACAFEFINGFHDTANAVATVIYTRSLKPWTAVLWSGICNFIGVFIGGISVAMGIVKLLPADVLASNNTSLSLIAVFSMLLSSCIWNLGTWYFGIPASSSHALIGGILGVGVGHAISNGNTISSGVNWTKTSEVGLSLLISPLLGFLLAALGLVLLKAMTRNSNRLHSPQIPGKTPPIPIRIALIGTSTGVSLAHGSNDGQKGVGLMMMILIALLPAQFSLNPSVSSEKIAQAILSARQIEITVASLSESSRNEKGILIRNAHANPEKPLSEKTQKAMEKSLVLSAQIQDDLKGASSTADVTEEKRLRLHSNIVQLESGLSTLERAGYALPDTKKARKALFSIIEYAPFWVIVLIAISLGLGTMIGWRRVVETIGEKIGTSELTYAQGAVAQSVAMSMIGVSALVGVPVSTTHCLSSGVAGTMIGAGSSVRGSTIKTILMAWVLTLPVTLGLSAGFYLLFRTLIHP